MKRGVDYPDLERLLREDRVPTDLQAAVQQELEWHAKACENLENAMRDIQNTCPHERVKRVYQRVAEGENYDRCQDCGLIGHRILSPKKREQKIEILDEIDKLEVKTKLLQAELEELG